MRKLGINWRKQVICVSPSRFLQKYILKRVFWKIYRYNLDECLVRSSHLHE